MNAEDRDNQVRQADTNQSDREYTAYHGKKTGFSLSCKQKIQALTTINGYWPPGSRDEAIWHTGSISTVQELFSMRRAFNRSDIWDDKTADDLIRYWISRTEQFYGASDSPIPPRSH